MNNFVVCTIIILQNSAFGITEYNTAINIKNLILVTINYMKLQLC